MYKSFIPDNLNCSSVIYDKLNNTTQFNGVKSGQYKLAFGTTGAIRDG